jgi:hypothetical protein
MSSPKRHFLTTTNGAFPTRPIRFVIHLASGRAPGYHAHGAECSVQELLSDRWRNHLRICGALWLVPLLERFAAGERLTTNAVLDSYEQQHGHPPPFRDV